MAEGWETPGVPPGPRDDALLAVDEQPAESSDGAGWHESEVGQCDQGQVAATGPPDHIAALLTEISGMIRELVSSSERYHARAEQREGVIGHLHAEVDRLRRGERRGLLRPLLVEICRLREDLLRQSEDLPGDFDADRARLLLRSYAESIELVLENSGVVTFAPDPGEPYQPRMHRRVGGEPTSDPGRAGRIARVRCSGYLDVDANSPITPAEVVVFAPVAVPLPEVPTEPAELSAASPRAEAGSLAGECGSADSASGGD